MKKIFSIWKNESSSGNDYFTGKLGDLSIIGFYNTNKTNDRQPDITFYVREENQSANQKDSKVQNNALENLNTDQVYADFGDSIELTDDDIAF